jgi:peptidoglycan/LPS O-acetylase OafA/YrhL
MQPDRSPGVVLDPNSPGAGEAISQAGELRSARVESLRGLAALRVMIGACVLPLRKGVVLRALEWRPLAFIGVCSYSLYLWHLPIVEHIWQGGWVHSFPALFAVAAPLSIGAAIVSYLAIESPFLRWRRRWASSPAPTAERSLVAELVAAR